MSVTAAARLRQRLTRRLYRALGALYRTAFPSTAPAGRLAPARVRRVLLGRTDRVGDLVVSTPVLAYLRTVLPADAEIDVVTSAAGSLLAGDPRVAHVYAPGRGLLEWVRLVRALRARRYDLVLSVRFRNHMAEGLTAALVAPRGAARVTVLRPPQYAGLFTRQVRLPPSQRHVVARLLYLAQAAVGDGPAPRAADLARYPASLADDPSAAARVAALAAARWAGRPFVALNAWASDPRRALGPALAARVAAAVAARHPALAVVLTPPPGAEAEAAAVAYDAAALATAAGAPAPLVAVLPPSTDLRDLAALLRRAAAVVSGDTANVHLAAAVGAPLVAVYTDLAVEAAVWGAWGGVQRVVHVRDGRPVSAIPPAAVADALDDLFGAPAGVGAGAGTAKTVDRMHRITQDAQDDGNSNNH